MKSIDDGASSGSASGAPAAASAPSKHPEGVPSWIAVGRKLHWWSESQKKNMPVRVTKVDEKKKLIYVTFEVDQTAYKSVPFAKIGKKDCPLRNPDELAGKRSTEATSKTNPKEKKRKEEKDGSVTPDWWSKEQMKMLDDQKAKREQLAAEEKKKEEERKREEQKRRALVEAERRKVEQAFEKRKAEAEAQRRKEEEEWRQNLLKRRAQETAEQEEKEKEREERRKKRREEKEKKKALEKAEEKANPKVEAAPPVVAPPAPPPPKVATVNPPPPAVQPAPLSIAGAPLAHALHWAGAAQMPAAVAAGATPLAVAAGATPMPAAMAAMHMMGFRHQGDMTAVPGNCANAAGAGLAAPGLGATVAGAWGPLANGHAGSPVFMAGPNASGAAQLLPGIGFAAPTGEGGATAAQWGGAWAVPQANGVWAAGGKGNFQAGVPGGQW